MASSVARGFADEWFPWLVVSLAKGVLGWWCSWLVVCSGDQFQLYQPGTGLQIAMHFQVWAPSLYPLLCYP